MNNDTVVTYNWLSNLLACLWSSAKIGAVGPVTNYCSNYQQIPVDYKTLGQMQEFARKINVSDPGLWERRLNLIGYCLLIKREAIDSVGLLDEDFSPGNYEDDDYSMRLIKKGYHLVLCRDTFIHHFGSSSFKKDRQKYAELLISNSAKFKKKWGFDRNYSLFIRDDVIRFIEEPQNNRFKALEIGCACGATLLKIKNRFKHSSVFGIEINESAAEIAKTVAQVTSSDIEKENLSYEKNIFDYIILADLLEHLRDPWNILKNISQYLSPGGKVILSIPNVMHFSVISNLLNGRWGYSDAGIMDRTHLRFFTLFEANMMIYKAGLSMYKYQRNVLPLSSKDKVFIDKLNSICQTDNYKQFETYQYVIAAKKSDVT